MQCPVDRNHGQRDTHCRRRPRGETKGRPQQDRQHENRERQVAQRHGRCAEDDEQDCREACGKRNALRDARSGRAAGARSRARTSARTAQCWWRRPATTSAQTIAVLTGDARPVSRNVAVPTVAAMIGATRALTTVNRKMSAPRSNAKRPRAKRVASMAAARHSSVLPVAIATDGTTSCDATRFVRKAPIAAAGQARGPSTSNAATAMPAGGHTAVTLAFTAANESPSVPARK